MDIPIEERLIVAVDLDPQALGGRHGVWQKARAFMKCVRGTGVTVKFNSFLRAYGYDLIDIAHDYGLKFFADLKLVDIPNTLKFDGAFLYESKPEMVTVMCNAGIKGMRALQGELTSTKVLGVTVLTSLGEDDCKSIFTCSCEEGVYRFARMAKDAGIGQLILSPEEIRIIKSDIELELGLNTPGIRPTWHLSESDDQHRVMTPYKAIRAGADRIVVGRPIMNAMNPVDAIKRTLDEIEQALDDM